MHALRENVSGPVILYHLFIFLTTIFMITSLRECFIGQIELFSHVPVLRNFVEHLKSKNFNVCVVYLLDSQVC